MLPPPLRCLLPPSPPTHPPPHPTSHQRSGPFPSTDLCKTAATHSTNQSRYFATTPCVGLVSTACVLFRFRSEEHTSELPSLMRISYAVFCLKKNTTYNRI